MDDLTFGHRIDPESTDRPLAPCARSLIAATVRLGRVVSGDTGKFHGPDPRGADSAPCPRCGKACLVGAHRSAHCTACFTSFRADDPTACLTNAELIRRATDHIGRGTYEGNR